MLMHADTSTLVHSDEDYTTANEQRTWYNAFLTIETSAPEAIGQLKPCKQKCAIEWEEGQACVLVCSHLNNDMICTLTEAA